MHLPSTFNKSSIVVEDLTEHDSLTNLFNNQFVFVINDTPGVWDQYIYDAIPRLGLNLIKELK